MLRKDSEIKDNRKFYTLSVVAYSALEDIQEDESQFNRFLHFAMEGWKEFSFDLAHNYGVHTVELPMKSWKQVDLPLGFVDWSKVGFKCGNFIKILTNDKNIPQVHEKGADCDPVENKPCEDIVDVRVNDNVIDFYNPYEWLDNNYYGYGVKENHLGYFRVDQKAGVINFKETANNNDKVYLEYITDGIDYEGSTVVHPYAFKLLKYWIHWQRKMNDDRYSIGQVDAAERVYNNQWMDVAVRNMDLSIDDIQEALRQGYTQVPQN